MRIRFEVDGATFHVSLADSAAARSLVEQLPLTAPMQDFHGIEKIAKLPQRLSIAGAPGGTAASAGDLTYYAPWGNLAFFYKSFGYADGLVSLGTVDEGPDVLTRIGEGSLATITAVD